MPLLLPVYICLKGWGNLWFVAMGCYNKNYSKCIWQGKKHASILKHYSCTVMENYSPSVYSTLTESKAYRRLSLGRRHGSMHWGH